MKTVWASSPSSVPSCTTDSVFHGSIPPVAVIKQSSTVKKVLQPCWLSKYVGSILCLTLLLYFLCKYFDFVCSKPTLTINIKDAVCVGVVSSVVSVCEGDASRQGMLGNTKQRGTELSLILQGQHPRERTSGVLTSLVCKHEKGFRVQKKITV